MAKEKGRDLYLRTIEDGDGEEVPEGWSGVLGDRETSKIIIAEFEIGEECIAFIEFKDGSYEVGIGESLRPYQRLYEGDRFSQALTDFCEAVKQHALLDRMSL